MKTGKKHIILYVILLLLVLVSCSDRRTVIGVSQCSDDIWRQKVNREIKIGQYQYKNVDVVFASATFALALSRVWLDKKSVPTPWASIDPVKE